LAEAGEFTKRAFLNGRIDLAQAEAVLDIIRAKTDSALKVGLQQLKGGLSKELNKIRQKLLDILCLLEAGIDFPEEEMASVNAKVLSSQLEAIDNNLKRILEAAKTGRVFREGISVVICGKPNVGKSSLLNALLKKERSIVTPVAGTTRDTIEEIIDIKGIPVKIVDTAGIIEPRDLVEKKAVQRSQKYIRQADLVILVFDASKCLEKEDALLMRKLRDKAVIAVINKIDLRLKLQRERVGARFEHLVGICAKRMQNINLLEEAIVGLVYKGKVAASEPVLVSNLRHIESIRKAQKLIAEAANSLDNSLSLPVEFIAQDIRDALGYIDDILGKKFSEGLLDKIFSEFCIGK
jgi:tRNA modification GTPase